MVKEKGSRQQMVNEAVGQGSSDVVGQRPLRIAVKKVKFGGQRSGRENQLKSDLTNSGQRPSSVSESTEPEPLHDTVRATYREDLNLFFIHNFIVRRFRHLKHHGLERLRRQRDEQIHKIARRQTVVERKKTLATLEQLEQEIQSIEQETQFHTYLERARPLLEQYKELGLARTVVSFDPGRHRTTGLTDKERHRHEIIERYLEVAQTNGGIKTDVIRDLPTLDGCQTCHQPLDETLEQIIDEDGLYYCPNCGTEQLVTVSTAYHKDHEKVNISNRNNYEDKENFKKIIDQYQGRQPDHIPEELFEKLDRYFRDHGLPTGAQVRAMPPDPRTGRKGTFKTPLTREPRRFTKEDLYSALQNIGEVEYYKHANLICHRYWDWPLPNIRHLEEAILNDYDLSQRVFEQIKEDRKSCLNAQYRLYRHLLRYRDALDYTLDYNDFKSVKTREIVEYHENKWRQICEQLGWAFEPIL